MFASLVLSRGGSSGRGLEVWRPGGLEASGLFPGLEDGVSQLVGGDGESLILTPVCHAGLTGTS